MTESDDGERLRRSDTESDDGERQLMDATSGRDQRRWMRAAKGLRWIGVVVVRAADRAAVVAAVLEGPA